MSEADILARGLATPKEWGAIRGVRAGPLPEGQAWARSRGLLLVDTKYEFGKVGSTLYVIDEMHTPDSSRYWRASEYERRLRAGQDQAMLDKETVRQWLIREKGFTGHGPLPVIPEDIRIKTAETYLDAYQVITGGALPLDSRGRCRAHSRQPHHPRLPLAAQKRATLGHLWPGSPWRPRSRRASRSSEGVVAEALKQFQKLASWRAACIVRFTCAASSQTEKSFRTSVSFTANSAWPAWPAACGW